MCQGNYIKRHPNLCARCGHTHAANRCHVWNAVCNKCRMVGHFARVCSSVEKNPKSNNSRKRDEERMTAFVRRKHAKAALLFIHAETDFILEMQINSSTHSPVIPNLMKNCWIQQHCKFHNVSFLLWWLIIQAKK
jgi:hypothetical protein